MAPRDIRVGVHTGPAKKPDKQCIDTYATDDWGNLINDKIERGPYYCMDPTGERSDIMQHCPTEEYHISNR